jgi:hypothetical protein
MVRFHPAPIVTAVLMLALSLCAAAEAQLAARISTPILTGPYASLAVADFDGDGKLDLAVVGSELQIFLGNGDGTFQAPINYTVGRDPGAVVVADFNGDGKLDLAVVNVISSSVSVLFGNGDGTFQFQAPLNTATFPTNLSVGDFNGDGKPDLILQDSESNILSLTVFLNNGDGTFRGPIRTPVPEMSDGLGVADFDRNGTLDVAVPESTLTSISVGILFGNGDGTFSLGPSYPIGPEPMSITVADFRRDGKLDLAISSFLGGVVNVLLGNGDGTFQPAFNYRSEFADAIVAGDINGDGKLDMIVSNSDLNGFSVGSVSIFLGNGDGTFQPENVLPAIKYSTFLGLGDFNGDGKLDVIDMDWSDGYLLTMLNTGVAVFSPDTAVKFPAQLLGTTGPERTVTLTNSGQTPMVFQAVDYSGEPFRMVGNTCKGNLAPGDQCTITATFTAQVKGTTTGTVTIRDSASSKPQVVELVGTGTVVEFSPSRLRFVPQKVGTSSAPQVMKITNTSAEPLIFSHFIYIVGTNDLDFTESDNCGTQIGPGASCNSNVTFSPRKTGPRIANLHVQDNGGGSPQTPRLSGTGN